MFFVKNLIFYQGWLFCKLYQKRCFLIFYTVKNNFETKKVNFSKGLVHGFCQKGNIGSTVFLAQIKSEKTVFLYSGYKRMLLRPK